MKSCPTYFANLLFWASLFFTTIGSAQTINDNFTKVRPNRWAPNIINWHEFYTSSILATDIDFEWSGDYDTASVLFGPPDKGNVGLGANYGFGVGYRFKLGADDLPQSLGLGLRAELYPSQFAKYALTFDAKLLVLGTGQTFAGIISGGELNISTYLPKNINEFRTSIVLVEARHKNIEFIWSLQSYSDFLFENQFIDEAFSVYRINYIIRK